MVEWSPETHYYINSTGVLSFTLFHQNLGAYYFLVYVYIKIQVTIHALINITQLSRDSKLTLIFLLCNMNNIDLIIFNTTINSIKIKLLVWNVKIINLY